MLTINQAGDLINSVGLMVIFGFVFCLVNMVTNHVFKMKAIKAGNVESEKFLVLRKQLITGLGILIACFSWL